MKDDLVVEEPAELAEERLADHGADHGGIEVDESIDIESIELHSTRASVVENLGWETARPSDDPDALFADEGDGDGPVGLSDSPATETRSQLAELEDEHLHLAAELADLRRAAGEREQALQDYLAKTRALLRDREDELSDQVAQIASLTLECQGLRAQLPERVASSQPAEAGTMAVAEADPRSEILVSSLKQRLEERAHALTIAREEKERLARERAELAHALAERGAQVAKLLARLARLEGRRHLQDEFKTGLGRLLGMNAGQEHAAAGAPPPGSEEPTLAVDEPPEQEKASNPGQEAPPDNAAARLRRAGAAASKKAARRRRPRADAGLRRYLIALDPAREEVCELTRQRMYVGRGVEADVRVTDATVSRLHGALYLERGSTVVEDACSTNGVFVNTKRVRRAVLLDGDTVAFGTVRFQYRVGPASGRTS